MALWIDARKVCDVCSKSSATVVPIEDVRSGIFSPVGGWRLLSNKDRTFDVCSQTCEDKLCENMQNKGVPIITYRR